MHQHVSLLARPLVIVAMVMAAFTLSMGTASAADTTVTIEINSTVPLVNVPVLGVMTYELSCESSTEMRGPWSFDGTVNGAPASGSGQVEGNWDGGLNMTLTSIDTWEMAGLGRPSVPADVSAKSADGLVYVLRGGVTAPQAIEPALSNPCDGGATSYRVSSPGTGGEIVTQLPQTGAGVLGGDSGPAGGSSWLAYAAVAVVALSAGALSHRRAAR